MNWVDLTDALFFNALGYTFMIRIERKMGAYDWYVIKDGNTVASGCNAKISKAKEQCKTIYKQLKEAHNAVLAEA